ncbi:helicase-related protein [Paraburkholderia sp. 2C]
MIAFGVGKDIDLSLSGDEIGKAYRQELLNQNARSQGIYDRLYDKDEPGVLLADEVGKGKTYVALGVAFAALARKKGAKILVLTHSRRMAEVWQRRWDEISRCVSEERIAEWKSCGKKLYSNLSMFESDAANGTLPNISFSSYETLKKYGSDSRDAGFLRAALKQSVRSVGIRLQDAERNQLIKKVLDCDLRTVQDEQISPAQARRINLLLDPKTRDWKEGVHPQVENELDHIQARASLNGTRFDLLIVDEAHKLDGTVRHRVVSRLLHNRFKKCLLVTATPFALSVEQFRKRLFDFSHAIGVPKAFKDEISDLALDDFRQAVARRAPYPAKAELERKLRRHMVRASWDHESERAVQHWAGRTNSDALLPTLLLERSMESVLASGSRTHIASRRESFCSSWPAARKSLELSPLAAVDKHWTNAFWAVVAKHEVNDPKLRIAVEKLAELVSKNTKVVVFTQRIETSKALTKMLSKHPAVEKYSDVMSHRAEKFRRNIDKIVKWLDLEPDCAAGVAKIMSHSQDCPPIEMSAVKNWWRRHLKHLREAKMDTWKSLEPLVGTGRRLPVVVRHDAETDDEERNVEKFNLPSSPLVLIATPKAQEGIDLHHYCRHVVLFDLTWNPAAMEQRIGRVHRLGGSRRTNEKVEVIYCYQAGTYEQTMARRVQQRCEMMRVLLGAGQWLDAEQEVEELERYRMSFPA